MAQNVVSGNPASPRYERVPTAKMLLWLAIGSMIMLFAGLTSAYLVRKAEGNWLEFDLPWIFWISTGLIMLCSVTINMAVRALKKNDQKNLLIFLWITTGLGTAFLITQYLAWSELYSKGISFTGNPASSFLFVLTGLHVAHFFGGFIYLIVVLLRAIRKVYNAENTLAVRLCATYWHFLDVLWVYLFIFLMFAK